MNSDSTGHRLPSPFPSPPKDERGNRFAAVRGLWNAALLLIYPPHCRNCEVPLTFDDGIRICERCWGQVERLSGENCPRCGFPVSDMNPVRKGFCRQCPTGNLHFDSARAAVVYDGPVKELILALKFRYQEHIAPFLVDLLDPVWDREFRENVDLIIPVPLHWTRRRWREFNQSLLLARGLAARKGIGARDEILRRVRRTRPQSRTSGKGAKRRNVRGAFRVVLPREVTGKRVLLVDDVFTSGSTVNECARALKGAGAAEVHVLTLARAANPGSRGIAPT